VTEAERRAALEQVAAEVRGCRRCRLHEQRTQAVPGEGHASTEVLFVGEGPGLNEDRQGRPFVGPAGALLDELLATIGWRRDEVFITNVVKCRPPGNRDPEPDEIAACAPFLRRQVEILDPALVVTLGRHSMARFMPGAKIGSAHGTARPAPPETGAREALVFAMYHPAAALHQASLRPTLEADILRVPGVLVEARRRRLGIAAEAEAEAAADRAPAGEVPTASHEHRPSRPADALLPAAEAAVTSAVPLDAADEAAPARGATPAAEGVPSPRTAPGPAAAPEPIPSPEPPAPAEPSPLAEAELASTGDTDHGQLTLFTSA
jgi:DNA polymerase